MAKLKLERLYKVYDGRVKAVNDLSLEINHQDFIVFVGPSGCGKSTTLRMIAGLEEITSGKLYIDDVLVNEMPPKDRDIAMVFQSYALYPHKTVYENMAFGLRMAGLKDNEIKERILCLDREQDNDVVIVEIGGTVGDIECQPFLEAIRQLKNDIGRDSCLYIHVTLVPNIKASRELKTKPTQHSVKELRGLGIQPDIIVCRSEHPLSEEIKAKIALFCDIDKEAVIPNLDAETIYEVPLIFEQENLARIVCRRLGLDEGKPDLKDWKEIVEKIKNPKRHVEIGLVGKYVSMPDAYMSVIEALYHAGIETESEVKVKWIQSEELESEDADLDAILGGCDGILVPGGFGHRGVEGKIRGIQYAREHKIPFLGICLGMHCAVIEFARNVCGMHGANSSEFAPDTLYPVIDLMPDQRHVEDLGGTMRLGSFPCLLSASSKAYEAYGEAEVYERHRHRYEVNNAFRAALEEKGMALTGVSPDGRLVEVVEIPDHPWFVACQYHPEFKSRPNRCHPLFREFVSAALRQRERAD